MIALEPSAARAQACDRRMRERLAGSMRHIAERAAGELSVPAATLEAFLKRLDAGPVSPLVFGAYCDLVLALNDDELGVAQARIDEILAAPNHPGGPEIITFADPGADFASERYQRLVDTDAAMPFRVYPPRAEVAAACREQIAAAFALLDAGHPALAEEIRALLREIRIASGAEDPRAVNFDGASSYMLWGGILLNAQSSATAFDMALALAHESGHNLLFGLCTDGPLEDNDDGELYPSPLRRDPRPMDGIVHATYVCARMHQTVRQLLDSGALDAAQRAAAPRALAAHATAFADGMRIVERHARLTPLGRAVMDGATAHMRPA